MTAPQTTPTSTVLRAHGHFSKRTNGYFWDEQQVIRVQHTRDATKLQLHLNTPPGQQVQCLDVESFLYVVTGIHQLTAQQAASLFAAFVGIRSVTETLLTTYYASLAHKEQPAPWHGQMKQLRDMLATLPAFGYQPNQSEASCLEGGPTHDNHHIL